MAGLKKTKKDGTSPNLVLICFLIFFVLLSIGLGVFAYYGQDGQEKLRNELKVTKAADKEKGVQRKALEFYSRELQLGIGLSEMTPEELTEYKAAYDDYRAQPDNYKDVDKWVKELRKKNADSLGTFSQAESKYPTTFMDKVKAANDDAAESKSKLAALKAEYDEFRKNYDKIVTKYEADITKLQEDIKAGNDAALKAAQVTNDKFPALQTVMAKKLQDDLKKKDEGYTADLKDKDDQLARKNIEDPRAREADRGPHARRRHRQRRRRRRGGRHLAPRPVARHLPRHSALGSAARQDPPRRPGEPAGLHRHRLAARHLARDDVPGLLRHRARQGGPADEGDHRSHPRHRREHLRLQDHVAVQRTRRNHLAGHDRGPHASPARHREHVPRRGPPLQHVLRFAHHDRRQRRLHAGRHRVAGHADDARSCRSSPSSCGSSISTSTPT